MMKLETELTPEEHHWMLMLFGFAASYVQDIYPEKFNDTLRLLNKINEKNQNWIPYKIEE